MKNWILLVPVACALFVAGCASTDGTSMDGEGQDSYGADGSGVDAYGDGSGEDGMGGGLIGDDRETIVMNERIIYFAFNSADVDAPSMELLKQHGRYLADNPGERVRLEGHADERGSREYNIGLGERRAVSVQSILLVEGATSEQLTTVSFGEERPAVLESNDAAWALNRRVEIVYER